MLSDHFVAAVLEQCLAFAVAVADRSAAIDRQDGCIFLGACWNPCSRAGHSQAGCGGIQLVWINMGRCCAHVAGFSERPLSGNLNGRNAHDAVVACSDVNPRNGTKLWRCSIAAFASITNSGYPICLSTLVGSAEIVWR